MKDVIKQAKENDNFRKVLDTGEHTQLVLMSVEDEIGSEVHPDNDQIVYLVKGRGRAEIGGKINLFEEGDMVLVDAGVRHNFINYGGQPLKIVTTYSPPHHAPGTIHRTKEDAEREERGGAS